MKNRQFLRFIYNWASEASSLASHTPFRERKGGLVTTYTRSCSSARNLARPIRFVHLKNVGVLRHRQLTRDRTPELGREIFLVLVFVNQNNNVAWV